MSARAIVDLQEGSNTPAREALRDLSTAWPEDACLKQAAAYAALTDGEIQFGAALAEEARSLAPEMPATMLLHGFTQMMSGDIDGAADTWRAVLAVDPANAVANAALAAHHRLGDALLALPLLEKAQEGGINVDTLLLVAYYRAGELVQPSRHIRPGMATRRRRLSCRITRSGRCIPDPAGCRGRPAPRGRT